MGPDDLVEAARAVGVGDPRLLGAIRRIPRAGFVPSEHVHDAYLDRPVPIPHDQVTTQPSLSAAMIEALDLSPVDDVLEVGTGHGYQTALLTSLAGRVWSIERFPDLAETARRNLAAHGIDDVVVMVGDGTVGLPEAAPFDAVLVSAAFERVPEPLVAQLRVGGRLVQPIGPGGHDMVTLFRKESEGLVAVRQVIPARFVRLVGRHGFSPG